MCALLFFTLDAGLLAWSQYSEGPATGHIDTGFSWFPCVYKQMLRWFPRFQVATTCFSCSPPDLNHVLFTCKITTATGWQFINIIIIIIIIIMSRNTSVYTLTPVELLGNKKQCINSMLQKGKSLQSVRFHSVQKSKQPIWRTFTFVRILRLLVNHSLRLQNVRKLKDETMAHSINAKCVVFM